MATTVVSEVAITRETDHYTLSSHIRLESRPGKWDIRFRVPSAYGGFLTSRGDPFLAAMLEPCMVLREPLIIEAPVSPMLLAATDRIQDILRQWVAGAERIRIHPGEVRPAANCAPVGVGCFFSGGVDSFYSLLKNADILTHLILIHGFEQAHRNKELYEMIRGRMANVAAATGKGFVEVSTNVREFTDGVVAWTSYAGSVLGAVALLLPGLFRRVVIPAGLSYIQLLPHTTHPLLDPLWSNETTEIVHDGCEATRAEKILGTVASSDLALANLRVCWSHHAYNCGVCEKCLRTTITLWAAGRLDQCLTFPRPLAARTLRRLRLKNLAQLQYAEENLHLLDPGNSRHRPLLRILRKAIRRGRIRAAWRFMHGRLPWD